MSSDGDSSTDDAIAILYILMTSRLNKDQILHDQQSIVIFIRVCPLSDRLSVHVKL